MCRDTYTYARVHTYTCVNGVKLILILLWIDNIVCAPVRYGVTCPPTYAYPHLPQNNDVSRRYIDNRVFVTVIIILTRHNTWNGIARIELAVSFGRERHVGCKIRRSGWEFTRERPPHPSSRWPFILRACKNRYRSRYVLFYCFSVR